MEKTELTCYLPLNTKINFRLIKCLSVKDKNLNHLKENIGEYL